MNSYTELSARPMVGPSAENVYSASTSESQENTFLSGSGNNSNSNSSGGSAPSRGLRTLLFPWLDAMGRMLTHFVEPASIALM